MRSGTIGTVKRVCRPLLHVALIGVTELCVLAQDAPPPPPPVAPPPLMTRPVARPVVVRTFWDGIAKADALAIVETVYTVPENEIKLPPNIDPTFAAQIMAHRRKPKSRIAGLLTDDGVKQDEFKVPASLRRLISIEGRYLVPVRKSDDVYEACRGFYGLPVLADGKERHYRKRIEKWQKLDDDDERVKFLKDALGDGELVELQTDCIRELSGLGAFGEVLATKELDYWRGRMSDPVFTERSRSEILRALAESNFPAAKDIFQDALKDEDLASEAAGTYARRDREGFIELLMAWMDDPELRVVAIRSGRFLGPNPVLAGKVAASYTPADRPNLHQFVPYLLVEGNAEGAEIAKQVIAETGSASEAGQVMMHLLRSKDPQFADSAKKCAARFKSVPEPEDPLADMHPESDPNFHVRFPNDPKLVVAHCLGYLCAIKDVEGVAMTKQYLDSLDKKQVAHMSLQVCLSGVARKRFKDVDQCREWLDSLLPQPEAAGTPGEKTDGKE